MAYKTWLYLPIWHIEVRKSLIIKHGYIRNLELMKHLSRWMKELFGYDDSQILYDLTNVYAEGDYDGSKW